LQKEGDLTLLRVDVTGRETGGTRRRRFEMVDRYDRRHGITSMARTTAFPCSVAAQILGSGRISRKGLIPPELAFKGNLRAEFLEYLADRDMMIKSKFM